MLRGVVYDKWRELLAIMPSMHVVGKRPTASAAI
jgi:hypothetical protein